MNPVGQALKEEREGANLSSQVSNFAPMTLVVPASDVHDIVCGAKRSLHVLFCFLKELRPYLRTRLLMVLRSSIRRLGAAMINGIGRLVSPEEYGER